MKLHSATRWLLVSGIVLSSSAKADDKFVCPITKPTPIAFVPAGTFAGKQATLLGTEKLFTLFPGNWQNTQKTERGYRVPKIVWGTEAFDLKQEWTRSSLAITGQRLDADSDTLQFEHANTARIGDRFFITSEFYVTNLGCWEVTGHFHGTDLKIVVDLK